jgi:hypothetical protein
VNSPVLPLITIDHRLSSGRDDDDVQPSEAAL